MTTATTTRTATITCGKCRGKHSTAAEVRRCYFPRQETLTPVAPATRIMEVRATQRATSAPAAPVAPVEDVLAGIEDGRYALGTDENATFFQVTTRRNGQRTLYRLSGAPGNWRKRQLFGTRAADTFRLIAEDPAAAMVRFGRTFGVCGRCVSPLSDAVSRARFIGPDCAVTMGLESHHDYAVRHPHLHSVY